MAEIGIPRQMFLEILRLIAELRAEAAARGSMRRRRSLGLGLQATVHQHEQPFREARKIATMCLKFGVPGEIPDQAGGGTMRAQ
jgi:hypothetical protein